MNQYQVAFIVCTNNELYYDECVRYIKELRVPEGYSVDIIKIQGAESMTQGYNAGMRESDAKYKVYLHHDTFILNRDFIADSLKVFNQDENIGMLGVVGAEELPPDALCYTAWNSGQCIAYDGNNKVYVVLAQKPGTLYSEVKAVDGLLIMTQYDIEWREDFLDGWDFYDVSHSLEMQKRGYKVVIPYQERPWCYHDCGNSKVKQYDFYREKMIAEYPEIFSEKLLKEDVEQRQEELKELEATREMMIRLISLGEYDRLEDCTRELQPLWFADTQIREIINLMRIYHLEKTQSNTRSEWWSWKSWDKIYKDYNELRHILIRIEFQRQDERIKNMYDRVGKGLLSQEAVRSIAKRMYGVR